MRQDLRNALRALRRAPAFSLTAIGTLAIAIASATAVFSVIDAVVLRGLPYAAPQQIYGVYERNESGDLRVAAYPTFQDWQRQAASVRNAIEGMAFVRGDAVQIPGRDGPVREIAAYVTPGFFQLLGTPPMLGRTFLPDDERAGSPPVAIISHAAFVERYASGRGVLGKKIVIDSVPTTIVGVMPRGFAYPNFGGNGWAPPVVWQPIAPYKATHSSLTLRGLHADSRSILRLRSGVDSARAAVAMRAIEQRLAKEYPAEQAHWTSVTMRPIADETFGGLRSTLWLISGAVALVVLLACANVANLLLLRTSTRARELAVRAALGAGMWRLARQLLLEAALIAAAGGILGTALALVLLALLRPFAANRLPFATNIGIDSHAAAFAIAVTTFTAFAVGVMPALHASRGNLNARLRGGPALAGAGARDGKVRNALVLVQFALAVTVVTVAGLLIQSVHRVSSVPLGYDDSGTISFAFGVPSHRYDAPEQAAALYQRVLQATQAVRMVEASAAAGGGLLDTKVETDDHRGSTAAPLALYHPISSSYLKVLRIPLVAGRGFSERDMQSPSGFLITANLAKKLWPAATAIGRRITVYRSSQARADFGQPITMPVTGVVADYRQDGPENPPPRQVFLPYTLEVWPWMSFVVRAPPTAHAVRQITRAVKDVDPAIVFSAGPSASHGSAAASLADPRVFLMGLMSIFGLTALLLAAVGLYGIVAHGVALRNREIGVRIAIGATRGDIFRLLLGEIAKLVISGIIVGLLAAAFASKLLRSALFETSPLDPVTYLAAPTVLAAAALLAGLLPARRAARTDPIVVIKAE